MRENNYKKGIYLDNKYFKRPIVSLNEFKKKILINNAFFLLCNKKKEGQMVINFGKKGKVYNLGLFKKINKIRIDNAILIPKISKKSNKIFNINFEYKLKDGATNKINFKSNDVVFFICTIFKNKINNSYYIVDVGVELMQFNLIKYFQLSNQFEILIKKKLLIYPKNYILELEKVTKKKDEQK